MSYGGLLKGRVQRLWLASFKTSLSDYLSERITQIKNGDIPVDDLALRRSLINFYSEMITAYE